MKQKTFDVFFKREGNINDFLFRAWAPDSLVLPNWDFCPAIEDCSVADFLEELNTNGDVIEAKVTIKVK